MVKATIHLSSHDLLAAVSCDSHLRYSMQTNNSQVTSHGLGPGNVRALAEYVMTGVNTISVALRCYISMQ